jgi:hypothetical protein
LTDHIETFIVNYTGPENGTRECDNLGSIAFSLPAGNYDLTVTGLDANGLAIALSNPVPVTTGTGQPTAIFLGPIPDVRIGGAIVPGYFEWDIMLPSQASLVEFTYELLGGAGPGSNPAIETITAASRLTGAAAKSGPLASGSYWVTISLGGGWDIYRGSAHVYAGLTTTMTLEATHFHPVDLPGGTDPEVVLEVTPGTNLLTLSAEGSVLSADPAVFETPVWYIYTGRITATAQGLGNGGFTLDLDAAATALDLAFGSVYTATFLGKVKGTEPGFWFSQSKQFTRLAAIYVDAANGNDANNGRSEDKAFKTLEKALSMPFAGSFQPSKVIRVIGDYVINGSQTIDGAGKTTITRTDAADWQTNGQNDAVITVMGGVQVSFKNITIDGKNTGNADVFHRGLLIYGTNTTVTLDTGTVVTGKVEGETTGGGISLTGHASLVMKGDSAVQDSSAPKGGGVYLNQGSFTMEGNSVVKNNTVAGYAGGVHVDGPSFFIMKGNATVTGNTAGDSGGGVVIAGAFQMTESSVISLNTAAYRGGGVCQINGTFTLTGGTIYGSDAGVQFANTAPNSGAAYYNDNGTSTVTTSDDTITRP